MNTNNNSPIPSPPTPSNSTPSPDPKMNGDMDSSEPVHPQNQQQQRIFKRKSKPLNVTVEPEDKRKIIGDIFVEVANQVMVDLQLDPSQVLLAQGTLRPDLIESASKVASSKADVIKTHHNDRLDIGLCPSGLFHCRKFTKYQVYVLIIKPAIKPTCRPV